MEANQLCLRDAPIIMSPVLAKSQRPRFRMLNFETPTYALPLVTIKRYLSGKCFLVILYGNHSVVRLAKLASRAQSPSCSQSLKFTIITHSQEKKKNNI